MRENVELSSFTYLKNRRCW